MQADRIKLLLVEDNPADAHIIQYMLDTVQSPRFEPYRASRLGEARQFLLHNHADVVLLDLSLPDSRGAHTVQGVYEVAPEVPIVVMTGLDDEQVGMQAVQIGAQDYLLKGGLDPNLLVRSIRYAIERHRLRRELRSYQLSLEDKVWQRTEEIRAVFELSPDGFVTFDSLHRVTFVNRRFGELFGVAEDRLFGSSIDEVYDLLRSRYDDPAHFPAECRASTRELADLVLEIERPRPRFVRHGLRRVVGKEGRISGTIMYFQDITQLTVVDRMKTRFLNHASHELRSPLNFISGYAELLLTRDYPAEKRSELLRRVLGHARTMRKLVDDLLDLARIEARREVDVRRTWVPAQKVAAEAIDNFRALETRGTLSLVAPSEEIRVCVDREKTTQALNNLLSNALKYSPSGGPVTVRVERGLAQASSRNGCLITVQDQGIGMTPEQQDHAFERFWRADDAGSVPGTGLGMSLVKEYVELQRGEVWLSSRPGKGTTVSVWLPTDPSPDLSPGDALDDRQRL